MYYYLQLSEFIIYRLDTYYEQKLLNVAFNKLSSGLISKQAVLGRNLEYAKDKILKVCAFKKLLKHILHTFILLKVDNNIYTVPSEKDARKTYTVNMELGYCECWEGKTGKLCKHQIAVVKYMGVANKNIIPINDPTVKQHLYYIATGKSKELTFFLSLRDQISVRDEVMYL